MIINIIGLFEAEIHFELYEVADIIQSSQAAPASNWLRFFFKSMIEQEPIFLKAGFNRRHIGMVVRNEVY